MKDIIKDVPEIIDYIPIDNIHYEKLSEIYNNVVDSYELNEDELNDFLSEFDEDFQGISEDKYINEVINNKKKEILDLI